MLHLVYTLRPTAAARADQAAFWRWVGERERWFYDGLHMAADPRWYLCTVGADVHTLEHWISFRDEAGWGEYRVEVSRRCKQPAWEARRVEQERWWEVVAARLLNDALLPPAEARPVSEGGHPERRSGRRTREQGARAGHAAAKMPASR